MQVYELIPSIDDFKFLSQEQKDIKKYTKLIGEPFGEKWIPIKVNWKNKHCPTPNFIGVSPLNLGVHKNVMKFLINEGIPKLEFLPFENESDFYAINVLKTIDAIDYTKAKPVRISSGIIIFFDKYAFRQELIANVDIFRIPELSERIFVTDSFKELIEKEQFTGLSFKKIWDSEKEPFQVEL